MRQTAKIYGKSSIDKFGQPTYDSGTDFPCRFVKETKIIKDESGHDVRVDGNIKLFRDVSGLEVGARIEVDSTDYRVMSITESRNSLGKIHHYFSFLKLIEV